MLRTETITNATARTSGHPQQPLEIWARHFRPRRQAGAHGGGRAPEGLTTTNHGDGMMEKQSAVASATGRQAAATSTLEVNGTSLAYIDQGQGYPVVLIHSSGASHRQWRDLINRLSDRYRVLAPDLHGHGDSPLPVRGDEFNQADDLAFVQALAVLAGEPFHLVGHSYGGAVALQAALALENHLLSLTLVEPAAFHLLRLQGETEPWEEISSVAKRHIELVRQGELERCADEFMAYWIGAESWAALPADRRSAISRTMPSIAAVFPNLFQESTGLADYEHLNVPTLLMRATETTRAASRVVDLLLDILPDRELVEIQGAGHMAPVTHSGAVNDAIEAHLDYRTIMASRRDSVLPGSHPITGMLGLDSLGQAFF
jgi:pimeloyl-ACP methyl ester carboxylesterase